MKYKLFNSEGVETDGSDDRAYIVNLYERRWREGLGLGGWIEDENGKVVAGRKPIRTIDLTPTWTAILPVLVVALTDGSDKAKALAKEELQRMAQIADSASRKDD